MTLVYWHGEPQMHLSFCDRFKEPVIDVCVLSRGSPLVLGRKPSLIESAGRAMVTQPRPELLGHPPLVLMGSDRRPSSAWLAGGWLGSPGAPSH
jgi:hypothetical protein